MCVMNVYSTMGNFVEMEISVIIIYTAHLFVQSAKDKLANPLLSQLFTQQMKLF